MKTIIRINRALKELELAEKNNTTANSTATVPWIKVSLRSALTTTDAKEFKEFIMEAFESLNTLRQRDFGNEANANLHHAKEDLKQVLRENYLQD
jgi:hypothetical protein